MQVRREDWESKDKEEDEATLHRAKQIKEVEDSTYYTVAGEPSAFISVRTIYRGLLPWLFSQDKVVVLLASLY